MPPKASPHFLGLQLSVDALRAAIVDEQLELVGSEQIDFDVDFPEYKTRGGISTSVPDVYTTSVELWLKALDVLFERLQQNYDLSKIKAISGAAQLCPVWLTAEAPNILSSLSESSNLRDQLLARAIALVDVPVEQDSSAGRQATELETALGGPEAMASQVGVTTRASLLSAQMIHLRESMPEVWAQTSHVVLASAFLCSVVIGSLAPFSESEAAVTGLYSLPKDQWDEGVLQQVAGVNGDVSRVKKLLGNVERSAARPIGRIASYFKKYGFESDVSVYPFTSEHLASYLSVAPTQTDCVIEFGTTDILLVPTTKATPSPYFTTVPHPAQDPLTEKSRKYVSIIMTRNADVPRAFIRDMYTKSWSAFDRLVAVVPPGGSIGLDDKLFGFWLLQREEYPFSQANGIYRFETGIKVNEFRDLRANPRCLLESQILSFRVRLAHLITAGTFLPSRTLKPPKASQAVESIGNRFDPYDTSNLPKRVLATGSACTFPSVVGLLGDVFNAPVLIPNSLVEASNKEFAKESTGATGSTKSSSASRAALGAAYLARWGWRKSSRPDEKHPGFEDEVRWLMTKKSTVAGNGPVTSGGNRSRSVSAPGTAPGSSSYLSHHLHAKTGLAASSFAEEEEDEETYESSFGQYSGTVTPPRNPKAMPPTPSMSSGTSMGSISGSSANLIQSAMASPNLPLDIDQNGTGTHPPLAPIQPLNTDDVDIQLGLVKVAEPDHDTFLTYAAIVPEFCRLERMIVKGLV